MGKVKDIIKSSEYKKVEHDPVWGSIDYPEWEI